jgi:protein O-GlcNAc transferase
MGMNAISQQNYTSALGFLEKALELKPHHLETLYNVAHLQEVLGQWGQALARYENCLALQPQWPAAWNNRGNVLRATGRLDEALASYQKCLAVDPQVAAFVLPNLGQTQMDLRQYSAAHHSFSQAVQLTPNIPELWAQLGHCLRELRHFSEALSAYNQSLALQPAQPALHLVLAHLAFDRGDAIGIRNHLDALMVDNSSDAEALWTSVVLSVLPVCDSAHEEVLQRQGLTEALNRLTYAQSVKPNDGWHAHAVPKTLFYLAYHNQNNLDLLKRFGDLSVQALSSVERAVRASSGVVATTGGKIKVGVVSEFFRSHSVWEALVKGWVDHLNRDQFELHLFHLGHQEDDETRHAQSHADVWVACPSNLKNCAEQIFKSQVDVLIYPDLGISAVSYRLASMRLAPVQLATWGHPETTGLRTVDGFLSAEFLEPEDAQEHYTETLIRLPHLGCCVAPVCLKPKTPDLEKLGLTGSGPLLICGGTPFKYRPQHDGVLVRIAQMHPKAKIVLFEYAANPLYSHALKQRLNQAFAAEGLDATQHLRWVPWLSGEEFLGLMQQADVFLDSMGFSGFNTTIQALSSGLPVVAYEGEFLRGRLASGTMHYLGLSELVASDAEAYVNLVSRLISDVNFQADVSRKLASVGTNLFHDLAPIRALEEHLRTALQR